jgi:transcriptional regulator with XRE-family HTH domain
MNIQEVYQELDAFHVEAEKSHEFRAERAFLEFTERMLERMEELKMSRSELAAKIGVKPAYITKILRGDTNFTLDTMVKLASALDCKLVVGLEARAPKAKRAATKPSARLKKSGGKRAEKLVTA